MNYQNIIEFARENKGSIIESMKTSLASQFISRINNPGFNNIEELNELKIEERALSRTSELIEIVLEKMEKGDRIL